MLQVVWAITFIGVIILGIIAGRKVKNIQEWALGGRNLTWIDVGCILAAFQMGGTTIIGVAQNGFKIGYAGAWYSITGTIAMLCMLLVVKPLRRRTRRRQILLLFISVDGLLLHSHSALHSMHRNPVGDS